MATPTLLDAAASLPAAWFAAVEGAAFDNLPATLRASQLTGVPLYLEAGNEDGMRAGPHLVALPSRTELATLIALLDGKPAATFWSWPGGIDMLRRHLRGLNLAEIPNERRAGPDDPAYETVLFRHWDPNVLAVTLPVLTAEQRSRFLGEAAGLAFDASDYAGVTLATRPEELPGRQRGMLRFEVAQIEGITERRVAASHARIAAYLREVAPEQTRGMNDASLVSKISDLAGVASNFGFTSERDLGRFAFLQLVCGKEMLASDPSYVALVTTKALTARASMRLDAYFAGLEARLPGIP